MIFFERSMVFFALFWFKMFHSVLHLHKMIDEHVVWQEDYQMILDQLLQWHLDLIGGHDHDFVAVVVADDADEDDVVWE